MTLLGATTPGQSEPGSDSNEGILCIPQSSLSDCLASYKRHSLGGCLTPLQGCSRYILQPHPTGEKKRKGKKKKKQAKEERKKKERWKRKLVRKEKWEGN